VVMALVTTVSTTPLTTFLYPLWYQRKLESWKRGEIDWDGNPLPSSDTSDITPELSIEKLQNAQVRRLLVFLRLDSLPSLFTFITLLGGDTSIVSTKVHRSKLDLETIPEAESLAKSASALVSKRPLEVHGLRMLELTERTSSVMKVSELDEITYHDPVVNAFRTFAQLNNVAVSGGVSIVPEDSYAETLTTQASDHFSDLVLIPWSETNAILDGDLSHDAFSSGLQDSFVQRTLETSTCNTAILVNRGFGTPVRQEAQSLTRTTSGLSLRSRREAVTAPIADRSHHLYFPFFGGVDDRVALRFVLQLAHNSNITVTINHFITPLHSPRASKAPEVSEAASSPFGGRVGELPMNERVDTEALYDGAAQDTALLHTLRDSLPSDLATRVVFVDVPTTSPVADCLAHARQEVAQSPKNAGDLIVVGRGRHVTISNYESESSNGERSKTLGVVAESIISGGVRASVLVLQAGGRGLES
jgi:hypothetical protein